MAADHGYVIGTDPACDIVITDPYASKRHARMWQDPDGQVWVDDLGSTNGTWVIPPGERLGTKVSVPTRIGPGCTLRLGRTHFPWNPR